MNEWMHKELTKEWSEAVFRLHLSILKVQM